MKLCYHCMQQISSERARTCPKCGKSLQPEPQSERFLKPGTVLGRKYKVGYPLGAGGFGNTYIGWDEVLQRKITVKEFYPRQYCARAADGLHVAVTDEKLLARFQRGLQQFLTEARNVAALHEVRGVVEISNFFEENGTGYIVMEYLEGMDVKTILKESGGRKDYEWCRRVILTVLYTLREIHKRGVLHRDIAPDNVFVTREGIIKLIDFGAAKQESALHNTADIMLKAGYAPIEQYGRDFAQGPYTDLYAVAALFYRMLTGQKPLPANERLEQDALILPSEMGISIPKQAELAIMVCLNVIPEYRLQSAEEFMEALDGRFFIPVYEPEWILPEVKEKKGFMGTVAALPVAAKAALCLAGICLVLGGGLGAATMVHNARNAAELDGVESVMQDLRGKSEQEAEAYIQRLNLTHPGWDIRLETEDSVFDADAQKDGTIYAQSVAPGTALAGKDGEEGSAFDVISITLCSSQYIRYGEMSGMNAYALAKKLGIDTEDKDLFVEEEGSEDSSYFDLAYLEAGEEKITANALEKKKNRDKEILVADGVKIHYYASDFFYWESLPDFTQYDSIADVPKQAVYRYANEKEREKTGKKSLKNSNLVDDAYCALEEDGYQKGQIVGQTITAGEPYDESSPDKDEVLEIQVIGETLSYKGKTGDEFAKELREKGYGLYNFVLSDRTAGKGSWQIEKVKVIEAGKDGSPITGKELKYFSSVSNRDASTNNMDVFFVIYVKEPPKSAPATPPQNSNKADSQENKSDWHDIGIVEDHGSHDGN